MKKLVLLVAALGLWACGDENATVDTNTIPDQAKGELTGHVDNYMGLAIEGVEVTIEGTTLKGKSGKDGFWQIKDVPANTAHTLVYSMKGFITLHSTGTVTATIITDNSGDDDGDIALLGGTKADVGHVVMYPDSGSITFQVVDSMANPVAAFDYKVEFPAGTATGVVVGSGSNGTVTVAGVPAPEIFEFLNKSYTVTVTAKADGRGFAYGQGSRAMLAKEFLVAGQTPALALEDIERPYGGVIASNVLIAAERVWSPAQKNLIATNGQIVLAFEDGLQGAVVEAYVYTDARTTKEIKVLKATTEIVALGNQLKIVIPTDFGAAAGVMGYFRAQIAFPGTVTSDKIVQAPFFMGAISDPVTVALGSNSPIQLVEIEASGTSNSWETGDLGFRINLSQYVGLGTATGGAYNVVKLPVYFDADLNADNKREAKGEKGSNDPFCAEPVDVVHGTYGGIHGGYAKWFTLEQAAAGISVPPPSGGATTFPLPNVSINFDDWMKCNGGFIYNIWGQKASGELSGTATSLVLPAGNTL